MPHLIAIAYAEETIAAQAAEELERRADDLSIDPDAVGVIVCERDGSYQLTTSRHPGATAGWSKFWGVLLGVVMGDVEVSGIDPSFRQRIKAKMKPATSILFVVVGRVRPEQAVEALSQYGGTALKCSLANDPGIAELWSGRNGEPAQV
jgi:uncharacterized membrane protein